MKKTITKSDREALAKITTKDWFTADDIYHKVDRAVYRLKRMAEFGLLESDVRGAVPALYTVYRIPPKCKCGALLLGRNAQDVGQCLECFAESMSDDDTTEEE